ncbi:hypothetical protein MC885_003276 [Smutsia gigantea]|nr:hypothetical protein MC885_003276 [Smutsia gigantea]
MASTRSCWRILPIQTTQAAPEEVRNRSFRRELEERERELLQETKLRPSHSRAYTFSVSKKPQLDQISAANPDVDDLPTDVCVSFLPSS